MATRRIFSVSYTHLVLRRKDYTDGSVIDCRTGEKTAMELSGSNVLRYELADGTDRKSTRLNSSHSGESRMPSSA